MTGTSNCTVGIDLGRSLQVGDLAISKGTRQAPTQSDDGPPYGDNAFVPAEPWTALDYAAAAGWMANGPYGETTPVIKIHAFPREILRPFGELGIGRVRMLRHVEYLRRHPATAFALNCVVDYARYRLLRTEAEMECLGLSAYGDGMKTVSYDHQRKFRVGLHVDDWDDVPLANRLAARSVLVLNLGLGDRHFLFMDTPVERMPGADEPTARTSQVVKQFLANHPNEPVLRLTVRPGQAYIAPTGRLIHDGSNEQAGSLDVHLSLLGHFR